MYVVIMYLVLDKEKLLLFSLFCYAYSQQNSDNRYIIPIMFIS